MILRKANDDFLRMVYNMMDRPVYVVKVSTASDGQTMLKITGIMSFKHDNCAVYHSYDMEEFDLDDIVFRQKPAETFSEHIDEKEYASKCTGDFESVRNYCLSSNDLSMDGYNSIECTEKDFSEIIDLLRDGIYIVAFADAY